MTVLLFIFALFLGAFIGCLAMALAIAADDAYEDDEL